MQRLEKPREQDHRTWMMKSISERKCQGVKYEHGDGGRLTFKSTKGKGLCCFSEVEVVIQKCSDKKQGEGELQVAKSICKMSKVMYVGWVCIGK